MKAKILLMTFAVVLSCYFTFIFVLYLATRNSIPAEVMVVAPYEKFYIGLLYSSFVFIPLFFFVPVIALKKRLVGLWGYLSLMLIPVMAAWIAAHLVMLLMVERTPGPLLH